MKVGAECFTDGGHNCSTVAAIQKKTAKDGKRNMASRIIHKKDDKDMIAGWKRDLDRILQIFHVRSVGPT